jgi:hypothetical protein
VKIQKKMIYLQKKTAKKSRLPLQANGFGRKGKKE